MMKKIYSLITAFFVILAINAGEVTEQQALLKAQQFMKGKQFTLKNLRRAAPTENNAYYVFNVENNGGFVIVSGDDRIPDILAYSERGSLNLEKAPSNVKWILDYYKKVFLRLKDSPQTTWTTKRASLAPVSPMITTTWDQGTPYNDLCPIYRNERCLTGCVATALAQVINYNRWPQEMTKSVPSYTSAKLNIEMPALEPTQFNWGNMTNNDIARLMLYCGQAVQMDYGIDESGASSYMEAVALTSVFGYSQTTHQVSRDSYSEEEWETLLYNELAEGRPIIYDGRGSGGGHAFVLHGYENGLFYVNWGWGGAEDGYFRLTGLETNMGDYNSDQSATIGIRPPTGFTPDRPSVIVKEVNYYGTRFVSRSVDRSFDIAVQAKLVSDLQESTTLAIGLGIYNDSGLLKVLSQESHTFIPAEEYEMNASFTIDTSLEDGVYRIVPVSRTSDSDNWKADANASDYYLEAKIDGEWMRLRTFQLNADERTIEDIGVTTANGISYALYKQYGREKASVLGVANGKLRGEIYIPDDLDCNGSTYHVAKSEYNAFSDCPELISLSIGATVLYGISNCQNLTSLDLREGVCSLNNAIINCPKLKQIVLPATLTNIEHAVEWNDGIESIKFNNSRNVIFTFYPQWQIESMPSLRNIYFASPDAASFRYDAGELITNNQVTIHVPKDAKDKYETVGWQGWKIVEDQPLSSNHGIEWGYCNGWQVTDNTVYDECGNNNGEYAIHVPAEQLIPYQGMTISHIQFYQPAEGCDYVFITKPGTDYIVKQAAPFLEGAWMDVELAEPYVITGEELYVGVGRRGTIVTRISDTDTQISDGFWHRTMGTDISHDMIPGTWKYVPDQSEAFERPLPIRFVIDGEAKPADIAVLNIEVNRIEGETDKYNVKICVNNRSKEAISSFDFVWDVDGGQQNTKSFDTTLQPGQSSFHDFDFTASLQGRYHKFSYAVSNVNGTEDYIAANSSGTTPFVSSDTPIDDGRQIVNNVELKDGEVWWYNHDVNELGANQSCVGSQRVGVRYHVAIYIPEGLAGRKGTTVDGFSFYRNTLACQNVAVWVSTRLPKTELDADVEILDIPNNQLSTEIFKYHQVAFSQPHEIPEGGLYVGYSFDITADMMNAGYPCEFTNSAKNRNGGFWLKASNHPQWDDMTNNYGNLRAQVLLGGNVYKNAVRISDFSYASAVVGGKTKAQVTLSNEGSNPMDNVTVSIVGENGTEYERNVTLSIPLSVRLQANTSYIRATGTFELDADVTQGADKKTISVIKVNGVDNELQEGTSTTGILYSLVRQPKTTAVLENKTSTLSGGGTESMTIREKLSDIFGDKLIQVAFHRLDIMSIDEYQVLSDKTYNLEQGFINRRIIEDMYRGNYSEAWGIKKDVQDALNTIVPGYVSVKASWTDDDKNMIDIHADTHFMMDADKLPFRLGFVLLEDGLHGTGSAWAQANQLSGYNYEEEQLFDYWAAQPNPVEGLTFNNVPVAAWSPIYGIENSIPEKVIAEATNPYDLKADITDNRFIQDKENLSVIALIVDKNTGKIINAAKCKLGDTQSRVVTDGDANGDDNVNVSDIVEMVNYILGNPSDKFNKVAADVNNDGQVNVTDIVSVVNIILSPNARELTNRAAATHNLELNGGTIKLRNAEQYTAVQFDINLSNGQSVVNITMNGASDHHVIWKMVDKNTCRVIVYSMTSAPFRANKDVLLNIALKGTATISNELLVGVDGTVTGINEVHQKNEPANVYDLRGNKIRSNVTDLHGLAKGIYIINGKTVIHNKY